MYVVGSTRFNRNTWIENKRWRDMNEYKGCIYGTPNEISAKIILESTVFVIEMHNDENKIKDEPTLFQIKDVANNLIARMKSEGKMEMAIFFEKAKEKVINEIERDKNENSDDTETDTDVDYDEKINSSSSLLAGDKWWENDYAIMSQESRNGRSNVENMKVSNVKMIEYEKKVILEKLKMTEIRLRELEKENKKLKNKINMMK